jgi:DNA-binding transcriptional ArsR family regulator
MIEPEKVCKAIGAIDDASDVRDWAHRFSLLGDLTRIRLLPCIKASGPICVSDLTVATGVQGDTVSQTLRFLRATRTVTAERDGRVNRYRLADPVIGDILDQTGQPAPTPPASTAEKGTVQVQAGTVSKPSTEGESRPRRLAPRRIEPS